MQVWKYIKPQSYLPVNPFPSFSKSKNFNGIQLSSSPADVLFTKFKDTRSLTQIV